MLGNVTVKVLEAMAELCLLHIVKTIDFLFKLTDDNRSLSKEGL